MAAGRGSPAGILGSRRSCRAGAACWRHRRTRTPPLATAGLRRWSYRSPRCSAPPCRRPSSMRVAAGRLRLEATWAAQHSRPRRHAEAMAPNAGPSRRGIGWPALQRAARLADPSLLGWRCPLRRTGRPLAPRSCRRSVQRATRSAGASLAPSFTVWAARTGWHVSSATSASPERRSAAGRRSSRPGAPRTGSARPAGRRPQRRGFGRLGSR
mmetsp:Transcript_75266/g.224447  ORF Transcript_75266/g.224447 Transcript_75266/m.224447 type:complete len:212 (+) Transcript_75266:323-958(+)